jgi:hypothetical protein
VGNWSKRKTLRQLNPTAQQDWHEPRFGEVLPDQVTAIGRRPGIRRCSALGLERGDCQQERMEGSAYCYYHDKVQEGLTLPTADVYPVWPLPRTGYRLVVPAAA